MKKSILSLAERRDELFAEMASLRGLLNGSLVERYSTCSRKNCSCHTGKRHGPRLYLAVTGEKGQRQTYIPAACAARAAEGVTQARRLKAIIRELTSINLQLLREEAQEVDHE